MADEDIAAIRAGSAPSDARRAAVYGFAREFVSCRGKVGDGTAAAGLDAVGRRRRLRIAETRNRR